MKYKFRYEDPDHKKHVRYYNALNPTTAHEMFKATVSHSIRQPVTLLQVWKLHEDGWVEVTQE